MTLRIPFELDPRERLADENSAVNERHKSDVTDTFTVTLPLTAIKLWKEIINREITKFIDPIQTTRL